MSDNATLFTPWVPGFWRESADRSPDDTDSWHSAVELKLIMKLGRLADAREPGFPLRQDAPLDPGFHFARTHWIQGFMAFQLARRTPNVMLMVLVWPEFGLGGTNRPGPGPLAEHH